ncbi:unnamed protein product [Chilo suppressalis]|uniref:Maspardin n=1 Tax=Chilo suppressalis TaxID=168631 RepID=A0ABN8L9E6_CHISP|nr:unnamed protein product [Chilo suppressalis]
MEAEKEGIVVPLTLEDYCIKTQVKSTTQEPQLDMTDFYDDDYDDLDTDSDEELEGGEGDGDDSGNGESRPSRPSEALWPCEHGRSGGHGGPGGRLVPAGPQFLEVFGILGASGAFASFIPSNSCEPCPSGTLRAAWPPRDFLGYLGLLGPLDLLAWRIFDCGPKSVTCPLICLPPVSGTADIFFQQVMGLASRGVRVISAEPPPYWNLKEWCDGFKRLIDYLELDKVHLFGASLGGFIAQIFAEYTRNCPKVASLVLCNSFTDTSVFEYNDSSALFWLLPSLVLKRMLMGNFTTDKVDRRIAESIDFMVERVSILILLSLFI